MPENEKPSLSSGRLASAETEAETTAHARGDEMRHADIDYEKSDIHLRNVVVTGASVLIGAWIISFLLYFVFAFLMRHRESASLPALPVASLRAAPPGPRLQTAPRDELRQYEAREDYLLSHYLWVDKAKGVIAIPIDQAIRLVANRGIPPQKAPAGMELSKPVEGTRLTGLEGKVEPEAR